LSYLQADPPDWSVDASAYTGSATATIALYMNSEAVNGENNILGAFVDNVCRGVVSPTPFSGGWLYFLTIYGDESGDTVEFKTWISEIDMTLDVTETILYEIGSSTGTPDDPEIMNTYLNYDFPPILSGIPDQSIYVGESFEPINVNDYLELLDSDPISFTVAGNEDISFEFDSDSYSFLLNSEEGWIGGETVIVTATEITENGYSDSDTVYLEVLQQDLPPTLLNIPDQIIGTNNQFSINLNDYVVVQDGDDILFDYDLIGSPAVDGQPSWSLNPSSFEFSMAATVIVESRGDLSQGSGNILAGFSSDGEVRAVASPIEFSDMWIYFTTIYSNTDGDTISFRFFDQNCLCDLSIKDRVVFINNDILGDPDSPVLFRAGFLYLDVDSNGFATITPSESLWIGTETVLFTATDDSTFNSYSSSDTILISSINAIGPTLSDIPDQSVLLGSSFSSFDLVDYLGGNYSSGIEWGVSGQENLSVEFSGSVVAIDPPLSWSGSESLIFHATESGGNNLIASDIVTFEVTISQFTSPELESIEDPPAVYEDGDNIIVSVTPIDVDPGASLVVTVSTNNNVLFPSLDVFPSTAGSGVERTITMDPADNQFGTAQVTVYVNDGTFVVSEEFTVSVTSVNDAPVITSTPSTEATDGTEYSYTITSTDIDGDVLIFSAPTLATWLNFDTDSHLLSGVPTNDDIGDHPVVLRVNDGSVDVDQVFTIVVVNTNNPPALNPIENPQAVDEDGDNISVIITPTDPDEGATLVASLTTDNTSLFSSFVVYPDTAYSGVERTITMDPADNQFGTAQVTVYINDGTFVVSEEFTVSVVSVNDAPVITSEPGTDVYEDSPYSYTLTAADVDGDNLSYSAIIIPQWLNFSSETQLLIGIPENSDVGAHSVLLRVNDGTVNVEQEFTLTIINTPDYGDVSLNGSTSSLDASLVLQYLAGMLELDGEQMGNADVTGDTSVSAYDASLILQYSMELIDVFPIESGETVEPASGSISMEDMNTGGLYSISVPIYLENEDNIFSFEFELLYENLFLDLSGIEISDSFSSFEVLHADEGGTINIVGASTYEGGDEGVFLSLNFNVSESFNENTTEIILSKLRLNENSELYNMTSAVLFNETVISVGYEPGWNIVGLPVQVGDPYYQSLFPNAESETLYTFDVNYLPSETLSPGSGYLLRLNESPDNILGISDNGNGTYNINYSSTDDIYGIQFTVVGGSVLWAYGGDAGQYEFVQQVDGNVVYCVSFVGTYIPAGSGILTVLTADGTVTSLENIVVSGAGGSSLDFYFWDLGINSTDFVGTSINEITIPLTVGWNLISGLSTSISTDQIYSNVFVQYGTVFGLDGVYYSADIIEPGVGYWVRASADGEMTLSSDALPKQAYFVNRAEEANVISFTSGHYTAELYFGVEIPESEILSYSLPPKPPAGAFDVRFKGDTRVVKEKSVIEVMGSSTDYLSVAFDIKIDAGLQKSWILSSDSGRDYILEGSEEISIPSSETFVLNRSSLTPATFVLHQNFPNPFNPNTTLSYGLPRDSYVRLAIYDMAGNEVARLVNSIQRAGFRSIQWDAKDSMGRAVSAGVYLYQIEADGTIQTKKMVVLK